MAPSWTSRPIRLSISRHEGLGLGLVRRIAVLNDVRQGQIEEIGGAALQQLDPGIEHEIGQIGIILVRRLAADEGLDIVDAGILHRRLVRLLRGKDDAALQVITDDLAQLVLRGHPGDAHPGLRQGAKDRFAAKHAGVGDHDLLAGAPVEIIIARDAVHRRHRAGQKRGVVGVGEAGHHPARGGREAVRAEPGEIGQEAVFQSLLQIGRIETVHADDDRGPARLAIAAAVDGNLLRRGGQSGMRQSDGPCPADHLPARRHECSMACHRERSSRPSSRNRLSEAG